MRGIRADNENCSKLYVDQPRMSESVDRPSMIANLLKYIRLYISFAKAGFIADLEYRANFVTRIFVDIFWYLAQVMTFESIYQFTDKIGSWNLAQSRVFLGVLFVVDAIYMIVISDNLDRFAEKIRKGDLDLILAKPVNSQFMISLQRVSTTLIANFLIGLSWFIFAVWNLPDFSFIRLLWLIVLIPCGLVSFYVIRFLIASTAVIFTRSENLQYMWYQLYRLGMRPDHIYVPWLKTLLLSLFPVGFIASVPARAILEPADLSLFAWVISFTVVLLWFSTWIWKKALGAYGSASS